MPDSTEQEQQELPVAPEAKDPTDNALHDLFDWWNNVESPQEPPPLEEPVGNPNNFKRIFNQEEILLPDTNKLPETPITDSNLERILGNKRERIAIAAAQKRQTLAPDKLPESVDDFLLLNPNANREQLIQYIENKNVELLNQSIKDQAISDAERDRPKTTGEHIQDGFASLGLGAINLVQTAQTLVQQSPAGKSPVLMKKLFDYIDSGETTDVETLDGLVEELTGRTLTSAIAGIKDSVRDEFISDPEKFAEEKIARKSAERELKDSLELGDDASLTDQTFRAIENFGAAVGDYVDNPTVAVNSAIQSLPELFLGGAAGKTASLAVVKGMSKKEAAEFLATEAGKKAVTRAATRAGVANTAIMEGISNGNDVKVEILKATPEVLNEGSPLYRDLIAAGKTHEEARLQVAENAFEMTAAISGTVGALSSKLTGAAKFEGNLFNFNSALGKSALAKITNTAGATISEGVEETIQGGAGKLAQNVGKQQFADEKQSLTQGVTDAAAAGLVTGALTGGTLGTIKSTSEAAVEAIGSGKEAVKTFVEQNTKVDKAINKGDISEIVNTKSKDYDSENAFIASTSGKILSDDIKERKQQLADAEGHLDTMRNEVLSELKEHTEAETDNSATMEKFARYQEYAQALEGLRTAEIPEQKREVQQAVKDIQSNASDSPAKVENVISTFGSSPEAVTIKQAQTVLDSGVSSKEQTTMLKNFIATKKSANEVTSDIFTGSADGKFKGINQHQAGINSALVRGDETGAKKLLTQFIGFGKTHATKLKDFNAATKAYEAKSAGKTFSQAAIDKVENTYDHQVGPGTKNVTKVISQELDALRTAAKESRYRVRNPISAAQVEETTQASPEATLRTEFEGLVKSIDSKGKLKKAFRQPVESFTDAQIKRHIKTLRQQDKDLSTPPVQSEAAKESPTTAATAVVEGTTEEASAKEKYSFKKSVLTGKRSTKTRTSRDVYYKDTKDKSGRIIKKGKLKTKGKVIKGVDNVISTFMAPTKDGDTNLISTTPDLLTSITQDAKLTSKLNDKQRKALPKVFQFSKAFSQRLNKMLVLKPAEHTSRDLFQLLLNEDGTLDENITTSMAMVSLNWLSTEANKTAYNNDRAINAILGRESKADISSREYELLGNIGTIRSTLAESLGREAIKVMGIQGKKDADGALEANLEMAIGNMIIGSLAQAGLITQQSMSTGLMAELRITNVDSFTSDVDDVPGQEQVTFVRILTEKSERGFDVPAKAIQGHVDNIRNSDGVLNELFGTTNPVTGPQLDKPTEAPKKIVGTSQNVPNAVESIIGKHQERPNTFKSNMMNVVDKLGVDGLAEISGYQTDYENNTHISEHAGIEGKNAAIMRSVDNLMEFRKQLPDRDTPFYFRHNIWKNMRAGIDSNTVNPQSDKMHRHVLGMDAHNITIDPNKDTETFNQFMVAVAESIGIKVDKNDTDTSIQQAQEILNSPVIQKGIKALVAFRQGKQLNKQAVIDAVKEGGENAFSLDGLVNYAEFVRMEGKPFKANIFREVDGVTNGVIIGLLQFAATATESQMKEMVSRGGVFTDGTENYNEFIKQPQNLDSYEDMARSWVSNLRDTSDVLEGQARTAFAALRYIVGPMSDQEGNIAKLGRDLAKNPLMITNYGAEITKVRGQFAAKIIDQFYSSLAKNKDNKEELLNITKVMSIMLGKPISITPSNALSFTLEKQDIETINTLIDNTYGDALEKAIKSKFQTFIDRRTELNEALQNMFNGFKAMYDHQVKLASEQLTEGTELSRQQLQTIEDSLLDSMPTFKAFFSKGAKDSLLVMKRKRVRQQTETRKVESQFAQPMDVFNVETNEETTTKSISSHSSKFEWEDGGVAGAILGIHGVDAATMMLLLDKYPALNVHDAAAFGLDQTMEGTQELNKAFATVMKDYSIRGEVNDSLQRVAKNLVAYDKKHGTELQGLIPKEYTAKFAKETKTHEKTRQDFMNQVTNWIQYNPGQGGSYAPKQSAPNLTNLGKTAVEESKSSLGSDSNLDPETFVAQYTDELDSESTMDMFNTLGKIGNIKDRAGHTQYLRDVVSNVVTKVIDPYTLYRSESGDITSGIANGDVYINSALPTNGLNFGTNLSSQEVFAHELVHNITATAVDSDALAARQLRDLYKQARDAKDSNGNKIITPESFLDESIDKNRPDYIAELKIATDRYNYIFGDKIGTRKHTYTDPIDGQTHTHTMSNAHHEFLAFGTTNASFRKALAKVDTTKPRKKREVEGFMGKLTGLIERILDTIFRRITGTTKLSTDRKLRVLLERLAGVDTRNKTTIHRAYDKAADITSKVINTATAAIVAPIKLLVESKPIKKSRFKVVRNLGNIVRMAPNTDFDAYAEAISKVRRKAGLTEDSLGGAFINEIKGRTKENSYLHDLGRLSNKVIDQARVHISSTIAKHVKDKYADNLDQANKDSITKALLKTDFSHLLQEGIYTAEQLSKLLTDSSYLQSEINKAKSEIKKEFPNNHHWFNSMADSLGSFMATGIPTQRFHLMNAHLIASLKHTNLKQEGSVSKAEQMVDTLASLAALSYTGAKHKELAGNLLKSEYSRGAENGIQFTLQLHNKSKQDSLEQLFRGKKALMVKGYTRELINPNTSFTVAPDTHEAELLKQGFVKGERVILDADDTSKVPMSVYISKNGLVDTYMAGILSFTGKKAKGTNVTNIYKQQGSIDPSLDAMLAMPSIMAKKSRHINAIAQGKGIPVKKHERVMIPTLNDDGDVVDFRYVLAEQHKDTILEKDNSFDTVLGAMEANVVDKTKSVEINNKVVKATHDEYLKHYRKNPRAYTAIGPKSNNPIYRDVYNMLPRETKEEIKRVWGTDTMFVKTEVAVLIFGQRKWSVTNLQQKHEKNLTGLKAVNQAVNNAAAWALNRPNIKFAESLWQEGIRAVKDAIVIKSGGVLVGNVVSNMFLLKVLGVSAKDIVKNKSRALAGAKAYQKDTEELERLKRENKLQGSSKRRDTRIAELEHLIAINPTRELIELGIHQSIIEDVEEDETKFTHQSRFERQLDENKVTGPIIRNTPELLKRGVRILTMQHDTDVYKFMRDATQLSDFSARFALHEHNINNGMSREDSISMIEEVFINYDLPTHRYIQYSNDIGVTMFTKFFVRIQKIIHYMIKNHPGSTLASLGLQGIIGDVSDVTDTIMTPANVYNKFNGDLLGLLAEIWESPVITETIGEAVD